MPAVDKGGVGNGPFQNAFAISPDDSADLPFLTSQIYVGVTGTLTVVLGSGDTVTLIAVPAGTQLRLRARRVMLTGTSAGGLIGLY